MRDKKYLDLFEGMGDIWSYKSSIITLDKEKADIMESGAATPQRRIEVLKTLSDMGIWTIWRMRPFIIGLTSLDYEKQIETAASIGVKAISTEFFCLELRSLNSAKNKYNMISDVVGFDIIQFYKNISSTSEYLRLNRKIKEPYYKRMKELCDKYGINLHVSDAHGKEYTASGSCCGLPDNQNGDYALTKYSRAQFTNALKICRQKGEVSWDDIAKDDVWMTEMTPLEAPGFNTGSTYKREKKCQVSMYTFMRNAWNNPKDANSPYRYFQGIMYPDRLDKNNNIVYKFNPYACQPEDCSGCSRMCKG